VCCPKGLADRQKAPLKLSSSFPTQPPTHPPLPSTFTATDRAVMAAAARRRQQPQASTLLLLLALLLLVTIAPAFLLLPTPSSSTRLHNNGQGQGDFDAPESDDGNSPPPAPSDMLARIMQVTLLARYIFYAVCLCLPSLPPFLPRSLLPRLHPLTDIQYLSPTGRAATTCFFGRRRRLGVVFLGVARYVLLGGKGGRGAREGKTGRLMTRRKKESKAGQMNSVHELILIPLYPS